MAIETFEYIDDLNVANPTATDNVSEGDDHLRGLKTTLKNTFPNVTGAINATETELNYVDGVTSAIQTQLDAKLSSVADNSVTLAKMAAGTDGNLITYDASGDPAYVATGSSGQVLTSGGTGVAPTFQTAAGGADTSLSNLTATGENKVAQAWVNFNGTGTVAIRDNHNVSSLVDHETGRWNVNFTNNLGNANYSISGQSGALSSSSRADSDAICTFHQPSTSSVGVQALYIHGDSRQDSDYVSCMVFGD